MLNPYLNDPGRRELGPWKIYPGYLGLLCTTQDFYFSNFLAIWNLNGESATPEMLVSLPGPWPLRWASRSRHLRRLGRLDVREMFRTPSGSLLAVRQKRIVRFSPEELVARTVLHVKDGGRPKGFTAAPSGHLFVGEYWGNPGRQPLRIWGSNDDGRSWETVYSTPAGRAKHIHNLVWDDHRQGIWVLIGDADYESALLFTDDGFRTVTEVAGGSQMFRACQLFCRPEGIYYATDTERAENWFVFLEEGFEKLHRLQPLPGSCIYAATMAGRHFLSTSVEPSRVNRHSSAALWSSQDLQTWHKIIEFKKDRWPGEYFGFGSIILPKVQGETSVVMFSTVALTPHDLTTFVVPVEELDRIREEGPWQ